MIIPILTTKLHKPIPAPNVIVRSQLFKRLDNGMNSKAMIVSAPAGFGKTTVIASWLETVDYPVAWLSLEEADNDLSRFLRYLVAALQTIRLEIGQQIMPILQSAQQPPLENILTVLVNDIASIETKCVLVLDDYHSLDLPEIDKALTFLIDHLPPQMTLVITTREDPQIPLAKYRARAELTELRAKDLRFSRDEMRLFLNHMMGLDLTTDALNALENRTEGWIASLQMVAISLQGQADKTQFIEAFTGSHRYIMDYLLEEVLQQQSDQIRDFLLQTAILSRLNVDLCDVVMQMTDSQKILEQLERSNLFIIALDSTRQWFRYHHLFADALQARLKREASETFIGAHRRASQWYEAHDYMSDAIYHAQQADDNMLFARLLELVWSEMDLNYQSARWFKWAKLLPEDFILTRPVMCLAYGWALINQGDFQAGEQYLHHAETYIDQDIHDVIVHDETQWHMLPAAILSARAYIAISTGQVEQAIRYAKESLALSTDPTQPSHRQASALLGFASWSMGDLQLADTALEDFMFAMRDIGVMSDAIALTGYLGALRIELGRLHDVHHMYQTAIQQLDESIALGVEELYRALAEFHLEVGRLDDAQTYLDISKSSGEQIALPTWEQRYAVTEAWYYAMLADYETALERLDFAEKTYLPTAMPDIRPISAQKARICLMQGRLVEVQHWANQYDSAMTTDLHYLQEYEYMTLARYLIALYQQSKQVEHYEQAMTLLGQLHKEAKAGLRFRSVIELSILQAELLALSDDVADSLSVLHQALDLAEPQGYVALFLLEGDAIKFLLQQSKHSYAKHLLTTFPDASTSMARNPQAGLLDALSEREIDVLQHMAEGLTNPEIAERLYISKHTVKVHTRNIYSKLDVNNRTQAVTKARSIGVISE